MEADEVFSNLSDKISTLDGKVGDFSGRIESLQSSLADLKGAADKTQADIDQIKEALNGLKSGGDAIKQTATQTVSLMDQMKRIEDANAASEKKYQEQQGLLGKLAAQADDAAKTFMNIGDTTNAAIKKAWDDGKKEILNTWDNSKKEILDSISTKTTQLIKDAKDGIKNEIKDDLKGLVFDDVKSVEADAKAAQPAPLTDDEFEAKVRAIMKRASTEPQ